MRSVSIFAVFVLVVLLVAALRPEALVPGQLLTWLEKNHEPLSGVVLLLKENHENLLWAALALAIVLLPAIFVIKPAKGTTKSPKARAEAVRPQAELPGTERCEAEIVAFLGVLQEKGRLVDFLMEEIVSYEDAQVGAAARVIHEGCRGALKEHFDIVPVCNENEGSKVVVPAGFSSDTYQLLGKITGEPPFTGTLVHKGWKTERVKLPRTLKDQGGRLSAIAPAQVELK
ncbi:MAG: DUF2760 domain-containing protein [Magnetococcales bacterium]|nr:DUF2760 domain-containing protein [Magnetococcales bacterium]MBF0148692.1 DUF2760 domain-containing protein [Magnetococcales bacterium]MBF0173329.1 DUF2760 domain-containing protein [Magnetococcales bacterium]MBF0347291.1 DUF2760 domain-containing protein [Magnetococcales bacterium]MBF0631498.1 DUF2760 domain-containing protein [Magnetococcales bacterium]